MDTLNERVRQRLRTERNKLKLTEQDLADQIGWTQSRVAQKLTGRTPITLDEMESLCFGLSLRPTEAVRDLGFEFCAELTPTELRALEKLRRLPTDLRDAFIRTLDIPQPTAPERFARPMRKKF